MTQIVHQLLRNLNYYYFKLCEVILKRAEDDFDNMFCFFRTVLFLIHQCVLPQQSLAIIIHGPSVAAAVLKTVCNLLGKAHNVSNL